MMLCVCQCVVCMCDCMCVYVAQHKLTVGEDDSGFSQAAVGRKVAVIWHQHRNTDEIASVQGISVFYYRCVNDHITQTAAE